jgi:hypothetical protein
LAKGRAQQFRKLRLIRDSVESCPSELLGLGCASRS